MTLPFPRRWLWLLPALALAATTLAASDELYLVEELDVGTTVSVGGTVVARQGVTLTAQIPGRVELIAGKEGDAFKKGDRLVALDVDDLLAQRAAAVSRLGSADAAVRNAHVQYSRELYSPQTSSSPGGMGLPNMMDQMFTNPMSSMMGIRQPQNERHAQIFSRGTQIEQARMTLQQARARIQEIDAKLRDSKSVAPFDGVISKKYVEIGDPVQPGQPLLDFIDPQGLQVQVDVPARLIPGLSQGMSVPAHLDMPEGDTQVIVARIFPTANQKRHTVRVKFDLLEPRGVSPGMYAEVTLPDPGQPSRHIIAIPRSAVVTRGGLSRVFVVGKDGRAELRLVRVGSPLDGGRIRILSGLKPGQKVVVRPAPGMRSGIMLKP